MSKPKYKYFTLKRLAQDFAKGIEDNGGIAWVNTLYGEDFTTGRNKFVQYGYKCEYFTGKQLNKKMGLI